MWAWGGCGVVRGGGVGVGVVHGVNAKQVGVGVVRGLVRGLVWVMVWCVVWCVVWCGVFCVCGVCSGSDDAFDV